MNNILCCFAAAAAVTSLVSDSVWPHRRQPPGSPVPGILQARTLEWVAISFSNVWKWKVKAKSLSQVRLLATPWTAAYQAPLSMGFSRQEWGAIAFSAMAYYLTIKKNTFESVLMRWMKLEPIIRSEVSQKEKHQYSILTHIYGI